jgi:hypothetical protein
LDTGGKGGNPRPGSGGNPSTGGFFGSDGGFVGTGATFGAGGFNFGAGGEFFGAGGFFGGGGFFETGGFFGTGAIFGAGGTFFASGGAAGSGNVFGSGGRMVDPNCCEAIPFCRAGYDQVSGPGECVKGDICYESTACCSTIWCKAHADEDAGACAEQAPPGVHYVSANASVCDPRSWKCPTYAYQYWDTCGCGCIQDTGCPAAVDCTAVPKDGLCTDNTTCPYTARTF